MAKTYLMHAMGIRKGMAFAKPHLRHFFEKSNHVHRHSRHMLAHGLHRHHHHHKLMHHKHHGHHGHSHKMEHHERHEHREHREEHGEGIHHKKRRPGPLKFNF